MLSGLSAISALSGIIGGKIVFAEAQLGTYINFEDFEIYEDGQTVSGLNSTTVFARDWEEMSAVKFNGLLIETVNVLDFETSIEGVAGPVTLAPMGIGTQQPAVGKVFNPYGFKGSNLEDELVGLIEDQLSQGERVVDPNLIVGSNLEDWPEGPLTDYQGTRVRLL